MDRFDGTRDPKTPPQSVLGPRARSAVLVGFVGSLVTFFILVGVAMVFWTVAHPRPHAREGLENFDGKPGDYATDGGHDPAWRPGSTRDELKYKGRLTPPTEARSR